MKKKNNTTEKTLQALLSGSHPLAKKYAGKHVFVIDKEVIPMKKGTKAMIDFKHLKTKYHHSPVLTYVPDPGVSYIHISSSRVSPEDLTQEQRDEY